MTDHPETSSPRRRSTQSGFPDENWEYLDHQPALDGLRGVAVLLVVAVHYAGDVFKGGGFGVDVFFLLSGFLITRLLLDEWHRTYTISISSFYARRALRLLPALILVVATVALTVRVLSNVGVVRQYVTWRDILGPLLYVGNFVAMANEGKANAMGHTWSLAVEEQFYIVWPLFMIFALHRTTPRALMRWIIVGLLIAVAVMAVRSAAGVRPVVLYAGPESRGAVALLAGAAVACWYQPPALATSALGRVSHALWPAAAAALIGFVFTTYQTDRWMFLGGYVVIMAINVVLLLACLDKSTALSTWLSREPWMWLGRVSYGLYLWHLPARAITQAALASRNPSRVTVAAIGITVSLIATVASYYLVEAPIRRYGRARLSRVLLK